MVGGGWQGGIESMLGRQPCFLSSTRVSLENSIAYDKLNLRWSHLLRPEDNS